MHRNRKACERVGGFFFKRRLLQSLYIGYRIYEDPESEQPRLHHSQLDRRSCRASPVLHQDAHCKKSEKYLIDNFGINVNAFDIVTGYRADDSYFDYAESFLNNAISVEQLAAAMKLGKLGEQIVLKSQFAFSRIRFEGFDVAEKEEFYVLRKARDDEANRLYLELLEEESDGLYIQDIIRGGITNDDSRIPRNISE